MDASYNPVMMSDYYSGFLAMDRVLYYVLAVELWHDPLVSVQILSLWIWLETLGFKDFVNNILCMSHDVINDFAFEAISCLRCIRNPEILVQSESRELELTSEFVKRKICILVLLGNREVVLCGIKKIMDVCAVIFRDAIDDAIMKHRARDLLNKVKSLSPVVEESLIHRFANLGFGGRNDRGVTPSPKRFFDSIQTSVRFQSGQQPVISRSSNLGFSNILTSTLPPEERSMFVTFSKGFPVSESELLDFFNMMFGDCIESFHIQQVMPGEQALYARVVFRLPFVIDLVLKGLPKAKFTINGKHLWMRRFVPRLTPTGS